MILSSQRNFDRPSRHPKRKLGCKDENPPKRSESATSVYRNFRSIGNRLVSIGVSDLVGKPEVERKMPRTLVKTLTLYSHVETPNRHCPHPEQSADDDGPESRPAILQNPVRRPEKKPRMSAIMQLAPNSARVMRIVHLFVLSRNSTPKVKANAHPTSVY